jgi:hypothetical protein
VIVRISGAGQRRISDDLAGRLNELDNEAVAAVERGDEGKFRELLDQMVKLVESEGEPLPEDELVASDVILPPPDTTLEEAGADFTGEGLIPD